MNFILRICIPSTLHVFTQHTEVLTICLDFTPDILKQPTFHDRVHYSLRIESLCKREVVRYIIRLTVVNRIIKTY